MTKQDIINRVYQYFVTEKHPKGVDSHDRCNYSAPCAIGIFLPRELAKRIDEKGSAGTAIHAVIEEYTEVRKIFEDVPTDFLSGIQQCHDNTFPWNNFPGRLREVADYYDLTLPE